MHPMHHLQAVLVEAGDGRVVSFTHGCPCHSHTIVRLRWGAKSIRGSYVGSEAIELMPKEQVIVCMRQVKGLSAKF